MIIAREKLRTNIAEYILYMWQIEEIIRANQFNIQAIYDTIVDHYEVSPAEKLEIRDWYQGLINAMKAEKVEAHGHLKSVQVYVEALEELHKKLLTIYQDDKYIEVYNEVKSLIAQLHSKGGGREQGEIESCLVGLFGLMTLRLQNKEISEETQSAFGGLSKMVALLSKRYKENKEGRLKMPIQMDN